MDSRRRSRGGTPSYLPKPVSKLASSSGASQDGASEPDRQHHSTDDLSDCDWQQLEERYTKAMEEHGKSEEELRDQISKLLEVFTSWSQTTVVRDEERALKRFKTQSQHVQNSEETLENKKKHYAEVVKAFESALALLNARMRP